MDHHVRAGLARTAAIALLGLLPITKAAAIEIIASNVTGIFALPTGSQHVQARLSVKPESATRAELDVTEWRHGKVITNYDIDMTKKVHMIVVSDDFTHFLHVHPVVGPDGHMRIDLDVPAPGGYHVYADDDPTGLGQQVFRFDVAFGKASRTEPQLAPTPHTVSAGPYLVHLNSLDLVASEPARLKIDISKNGRPADDLRPYLGGTAHAVFISPGTLSYTHVHPMQADDSRAEPSMAMGGPGQTSGMAGMNMSDMPDLPADASVDPHMLLDVTLARPGKYELWLQFHGGDRLYVAPFVVNVRPSSRGS